MANKKFILTFLVFISAILLGSFIILNTTFSQKYLADYIKKEIYSTNDFNISLDKIELSSINEVSINNFALYDKEDKPILEAKKIAIDFNIFKMLKNPSIESITNITISDATGYITEKKDGRFNFDDLIKEKKESSQEQYDFTITIKNSNLHLNIKNEAFTLKNINGDIDIADLKKIPFDLMFFFNDEKVHLIGKWQGLEEFDLKIESENQNLLPLLKFLPENINSIAQIDKMNLAKIDLSIKGKKDKPQLDGIIKIKDVDLQYKDFHLNDGEYIFNFVNENLNIFSQGKINGKKYRITSKNENIFQNPRGNLYLKIDDFNYENFIIKSGFIDYAYEKDKIFIGNSNFHINDGEILGKGYFDFASKDFSFKIFSKGVSLESLSNAIDYPLAGTIDFEGIISGNTKDLEKLEFNLAGKISRGNFDNIYFQNLDFNIYKEKSTIYFKAVNLALLNGGKVTFNGKLDNDKINGEIFGSDVNLTSFRKYLPEIDLTGKGNFYLKIDNTLDNPKVIIKSGLIDGTVLGRNYDNIKINGTLENHILQLDNFDLIEKDQLIYRGIGTIDLKNEEMDLTLDTQNGKINNILKLFTKDVALTGSFNNAMTIKGSFKNPEIQGKISFFDGLYENILIQKIIAQYEFVDGILNIKDLYIKTPFLTGNVKGTISKEGEMNLQLEDFLIDTSRLPIEYKEPIAGVVSARGILKGNLDNPIFDGEIHSDNISIREEGIYNLKAKVNLRDNLLRLDDFKFEISGGTFSLDAKYNLKNHWIFVLANLSDVESQGILKMTDIDNDLLRGNFSGKLEITGTKDKPEIYITGSMPYGYLKDYPLQDISLELNYKDDILHLSKFFGSQDKGKIGAIGKVDFKKDNLEGQLSATNMNPNLFVSLLGYDFKISGELNGDLQVKGKISNPDADFGIFIEGNKVDFDEGYILGNLKNHIININQAVIKKGSSAIKSYGIIPLAAINPEFRGKDSQNSEMNMKVYLENTDLDLLPNFFPQIEWSTGQVKGQVEITGTSAKPYFKGAITTEDSSLKLRFIEKPFTNIKGKINFLDQNINVENISADLGNGYMKFLANLLINDFKINSYDAKLIARNMDIKSPYYKGLLNGDMSITKMPYKDDFIPKLKVNLAFNNVEISMPPLPETSDTPLPLMGLDINVFVGKNVRAFDPMLYDLYLNGQFSIQGTTLNPEAKGEIVVNNGTINVLKNIFKVRVGTLNFNQYNSFFPSLDFKAETKIDRYDIFVSVTGPVDKDLNTKLYSSPQLSEGEILKMLTFKGLPDSDNFGSINQKDLLTFATMGLQMSFLNELESSLRNMLNLDLLKISQDTIVNKNALTMESTSKDVYNIQIGKYLSDDLMIRYTHGINYDFNRFGIQYDLSKNIGILGEYDKKNGFGIRLEMQWKF